MTCESTLILLGWYRYAVAKSESNQGLRSFLNALYYLGGFELLLPPALIFCVGLFFFLPRIVLYDLLRRCQLSRRTLLAPGFWYNLEAALNKRGL